MSEQLKTRSLYKNTIQIEFNDKNHRYKVNDKFGIISVTAVTGLLDKPALKFWACNMMEGELLEKNKNGIKITPEIIAEAKKAHTKKMEKEATSGSLVHEWAEAYILNQIEKKPKPEMPKDPRVLNGVIAFLKWVDEHGIKFLASELLLYSKKYKYAGLMDAKALIDKKLCAIDFKTSSGIYPEFFMQVAAYRGADEEETGKKYDETHIIQFDKDTGDFHSQKAKDHKKDYQSFLGLLKVKKWLTDFNIKLN